MDRLVLGTRGSPLALWQARHVADRLRSMHEELEVRLEIIKTQGDVRRDVPFGSLPGKGFFTKEIEEALLESRIDLAVHSLKDLPTELPEGLSISAVLERHDPRDAILNVDGLAFDELPPGTVVATGSPRRRSQLLFARPDLRCTPVRGNVDTRIRKLKEGQFGALVLALAGVQRLGLDEVPARPVSVTACLPAVGQGALAVETRSEDSSTIGLVEALAHEETGRAVAAERAFLARLGGGCLAPATAHARLEAGDVVVEGAVGDPDGKRLIRDRVQGRQGMETGLGEELAVRILGAGGEEILRAARIGSG